MSPAEYRAGQVVILAAAYGLWRVLKARERLQEAEARIAELERRRWH